MASEFEDPDMESVIEKGLRSLPLSKETCSGSIPCLPLIRVTQDAKGQPLAQPVVMRFPLFAEDCERLIALGTKTPFGKGSEKLQDDEVRLGWQLEPHQMAIAPSPFTAALSSSSDLMQSICMMLCPDATSVSAEFYKLVVYGKGGHFVKHRDTLRSANHVGTLLIGLPTEDGFEGGELVVHSHRHLGKPVKLSAEHWSRPDLSSSYVAFFTDAEHELLPVTRGHRLTMMYNIMAEIDPWRLRQSKARDDTITHEAKSDHEGEEKSDHEEEPPAPFESLPFDVAKMLRQMPKASTRRSWPYQYIGSARHVGFMLEHRYSLSNTKPEYLRGRDAVLYDLLVRHASEAQLLVCLEIVTVTAKREYEDGDDMENERCVEVTLGSSIITQFHLPVTYEEHGRQWEVDEEEANKLSSQPIDQGGPVLFVGGVELARMLPLYEIPAIECTGNEPAGETLGYNHVALIVSRASYPLRVLR